jgi:hypothetical protein
VAVTLFAGWLKAGALVAVALGVVLAGCSSVDDESLSTGSVTEPTTTSTASVTTTVVAATTSTLVLGPEIFDGDFYAAYNAGDWDTYFSFFAQGGAWRETTVGEQDADDFATWLTMVGAQMTDVVCYRDEPAKAQCTVRFTTDVYRAAGVVVTGYEELLFDEAGLIKQLSNGGDFNPWEDFDEAFAEWLSIVDSEAAARLKAYWDEGYRTKEYVEIQLAYMDEFLDWSDNYPRNVKIEHPPAPAPILTGSVRGVAVFNADDRQIELVEWALSRFDAQGLTVPPVVATTFPPTDACNEGFSGVAFHSDTGTDIEICVTPTDLAESGEFPTSARRTILHELAHVWNAALVDEPSRQTFLDFRGLDSWTGAEVWQENGSEQAAEIMTWALMDALIQPRIPNRGCNALTTAYEILTGTPPTIRTC